MNILIYTLSIIIILCFILIWYINIYNRYQNYIIRINEAEANIDSTLRKRFDLLNKAIGIIKSNTKEEKVLTMITNLRSKKLTNFDLDRKIYEAINEFLKYKEDYPDLKLNEDYMKIDLGLSETEAEIVASRKYYNDIITDYNRLVRSFPSNIVGKLSKCKIRNYFDGKDMNDDIIDDFKL